MPCKRRSAGHCRPAWRTASPAPSIRPTITWPNNARVAFWVAPNVEHYEYLPEYDGVRNPWPRTPYPDVQQYSYRDYGNRIGFWRMLDVLDKHAIPCTAAITGLPHCMWRPMTVPVAVVVLVREALRAQPNALRRQVAHGAGP